MEVFYKPVFIRQYNKLPTALKDEIKQKIVLFKNPQNHSLLRVHKLKGRLKNRMSFSVNYEYRIIFSWEVTNKSAVLLTVGSHDIYE